MSTYFPYSYIISFVKDVVSMHSFVGDWNVMDEPVAAVESAPVAISEIYY